MQTNNDTQCSAKPARQPVATRGSLTWDIYFSNSSNRHTVTFARARSQRPAKLACC